MAAIVVAAAFARPQSSARHEGYEIPALHKTVATKLDNGFSIFIRIRGLSSPRVHETQIVKLRPRIGRLCSTPESRWKKPNWRPIGIAGCRRLFGGHRPGKFVVSFVRGILESVLFARCEQARRVQIDLLSATPSIVQATSESAVK